MIAVIAMWILVILSVFSISVGSEARFEVEASRYHLNKKKTFQLAYSGIRLATELIDRDGSPKLDTPFEAWAAGTGAGTFDKLPLGAGWVSIGYERLNPVNDRFEPVFGIEDEDSKININFAPRSVLTALPGVDESIADCILDWRDADQRTRRHGAENRDYTNRERPYTCADRFFVNVDELLMVEGVDVDLLASLKPFVTVYGDSAVNVLTAAPEVLSAIGMPAVLVGKITRFRENPDAVGKG